MSDQRYISTFLRAFFLLAAFVTISCAHSPEEQTVVEPTANEPVAYAEPEIEPTFDSTLERRLSTLVSGLRNLPFDLDVQAVEDVVYVYGTARSVAERDKILRLLKDVRGVRSVQNHLEIVPPQKAEAHKGPIPESEWTGIPGAIKSFVTYVLATWALLLIFVFGYRWWSARRSGNRTQSSRPATGSARTI